MRQKGDATYLKMREKKAVSEKQTARYSKK